MEFPEVPDVEVYECERRARTVAAIKYIRQLRSLGLAEAKHLIDEVYCAGRTVTLSFTSGAEAGTFADEMRSMGFSCRVLVFDPERVVPTAQGEEALRRRPG